MLHARRRECQQPHPNGAASYGGYGGQGGTGTPNGTSGSDGTPTPPPQGVRE